jgi:hypothetical protein
VPEGAPALNVVAETGPDFGARQNAIAIKSGRERPAAFAAAVPGYWYWVERDDDESKVALMALTMLYRLLESGAPGNLPVLTIPAG